MEPIITCKRVKRERGYYMVTFDIDRFYLYLANSWVAYKQERKFIDNLYQSQRFRFYSKARANPLYNDSIVRNSPLEVDVTRRRAFGILLCSQDDKELQTIIIEEFYKLYPPIKKLCAQFSWREYEVLWHEYRNLCIAKNLSANEMNVFVYLVAYVVHCNHGFDTDDVDIQLLYEDAAANITRMFNNATEHLRRAIESIKPKERMTIPREMRKLQETILSGKDINDLVAIFQDYCNPNEGLCLNTRSFKYKQELLEPFWDKYWNDFYMAMMPLMILGLQLQFQDLSLASFFVDVEFSKEERDMGLKIAAYELEALYHEPVSSYRFHLYFQALVFGKVAKFIRECKDFYFANNRETQYDEMKRILLANTALQEENDRLNRTLQDKDRTIRSLQDQIHALSLDLSKDAREAQRPFNDAIVTLQSQVASLQEELEAEREKNTELNRLREFAFSIQSGVDIEEVKTPLKDLIAGKKIYICGGHINWRNKMKSTYPSLILLDGHQESFDEKILLSADIVLLNTGNMSHKVYYKIINMLRKSKIPFDYIGKTQNTGLLEREIAEILQGK